MPQSRSGLSPEHVINRDISWLDFNRRVLREAQDSRTPLLERLRFLSIFNSNLDEFVMKRVGGFRKKVVDQGPFGAVDGTEAVEHLKKIRARLVEDIDLQFECFQSVKSALAAEGIQLVNFEDLAKSDLVYLSEYFREFVFPILTPLSVDPGHPFPFISNLSFSLAISLQHPDEELPMFSRVKIPRAVPNWIKLPGKSDAQRFVPLEQVLKEHLHLLYPGMVIKDVVAFRVTRNAEFDQDDEDVEDLMEMIEEGLKERKFADCIRLEVPKGAGDWAVSVLQEALQLTDEDVYEIPGPMDYTLFGPVLSVERSDLKYEKWTSLPSKHLPSEREQVFSKLRFEDVLVHHPYESFASSVERFIIDASEDPSVLAIKMTLYRTGDRSPILRALKRAAENGKQVVCLVELKARFDEERNILSAQELEEAGVHVVYGIVGLKTHSKLALVIRKEHDGRMRPYCHIGTGNYNSQTANLYTDMGLLTTRSEICSEVIEVFNYLTGKSLKVDYEHLLVAPVTMKSRFLKLVQRERDHALAGKPAHIVAKMNQLEDAALISELYEASQAGVQITLFVRGFCCLRPGVKGVSENIRVFSIIGRFLEHSRFFYFANGHDDYFGGDYFIGSADWMYRNLHNRVEVITPIYEERIKRRISKLINIMMSDNRQSWELSSNGSYHQRDPGDDPESGTHATLMQHYLRRLSH